MTTPLPIEIQAALLKLEPLMFNAFMEAIAKVTSTAQLQTIVGHLEAGNIEAGNIEAAVLALKLDPSFFAPLDRALNEAQYQGAVMVLAGLPKIRDPFPVARSSSASMADMPGPNSGSAPKARG